MQVLMVVALVIFTLPSIAANREAMIQETSEAAEAIGDYASESKEEFTRKMRTNLKEMEADIDDLKRRAERAKSQGRSRLDQEIRDLEEKREALRKRLERLTASSGRAWTDLKTGMERAWSEVKVAYEKAADEFVDEKGAEKSRGQDKEMKRSSEKSATPKGEGENSL